MIDPDYLRSQRMTPEERDDFRRRHNLKSETTFSEDFSPEELWEMHSHHQEYGVANH